jgi:MFS family permease
MTFLMSPLCTLCCKHFGSRKTAIAGALTCSLGLVISSFVSSIKLLYFSYSILLGGGGSCLHISGILLVQRYFNEKRSLATGIVASGSSFGVMLGPLYQLLIEHFNWRITYRIIASWFSITLLLALLTYSPNIEDNINRIPCKHKINVVQAPTRKTWTNAYRPNIKCSFWSSSYAIAVMTITLQSLGIYTPLIHLVCTK